jgi:hypothetical protein
MGTALRACWCASGSDKPLQQLYDAHLPGSKDLRFWASVTALYCTLHTLSTSGTRRLNSSKQPQLPLAAADKQSHSQTLGVTSKLALTCAHSDSGHRPVRYKDYVHWARWISNSEAGYAAAGNVSHVDVPRPLKMSPMVR